MRGREREVERIERIPMKPRVTCPVYYKITYDRLKRAERTSFINSEPGRQIGKSVKVVV